jgi:outer membrane protein OmpA-like peptidoglycan-associated protein
MNASDSKLRRGALGLGLLACLAVLPVHAADPADRSQGQSPQAAVGAVSGLAIGAAAGGPIGAIIGVTAGAFLGDRLHQQKTDRAALAAELKASEAERARLALNVTELTTTLAAVQAQDTRNDQALHETNDLGMQVLFRTDDDALTVQSLPPLLKLGALAAALPEAKVRVDGFADPRGAAAYNDELSMRRAQGVAAALANAGVPADRIVVVAHGNASSDSAAGDLDAYALDRRVEVRLELPGSDQVARRD